MLEVEVDLVHPVDQDAAHLRRDVFRLKYVLSVYDFVLLQLTLTPDGLCFSRF